VKLTFLPLERTEHWDDLNSDLRHKLREDMTGFVGVDETGSILCAAIFDNWTSTSVQVHQVIRNPFVIRHGFFAEVSKYVYVTCDRAIMYGLVRASNKKALKLDLNIGFTEVARLKDAVMFGEDMVILELRKEDCKFLPQEFREAV